MMSPPLAPSRYVSGDEEARLRRCLLFKLFTENKLSSDGLRWRCMFYSGKRNSAKTGGFGPELSLSVSALHGRPGNGDENLTN